MLEFEKVALVLVFASREEAMNFKEVFELAKDLKIRVSALTG